MSQTVDMILNSSPKPDFDFKNDNEFEPGSKGCSETASDTSEKQNKKLGKREGCDYLVFGFWFLSNARRDGLITDELFTQLTEKMHLFDGCDQQREFMNQFVAKDNFKAHEKDLKLAVKSHAAALKPAKKSRKAKLDPDAPKPKRGRPTKPKVDNRTEEQKLCDEIIKAAQEAPVDTKENVDVSNEKLDLVEEAPSTPVEKPKKTKAPKAPKAPKKSKKVIEVVEVPPLELDEDDYEEEEVDVTEWHYDGKDYYKDNNNNIYDVKTQDKIGVFDPDANMIR